MPHNPKTFTTMFYVVLLGGEKIKCANYATAKFYLNLSGGSHIERGDYAYTIAN